MNALLIILPVIAGLIAPGPPRGIVGEKILLLKGQLRKFAII
jgi:hypothetical protein